MVSGCNKLTCEWFFASVDAHVVVEVALFPEAEVAVCAAMRLVLSVLPPMSQELGELLELAETWPETREQVRRQMTIIDAGRR